MKIAKKATNIQFTEAIEEYIERHLIQPVSKLIDPNDESAALSIEVGKTTRHHNKGDVFRAEANLHIAGRDLRAEEEREDLHSAIDKVRDELVRELTSFKKKRFDLVRRGGQRVKEFLRGFRNGR